MPRQDDQLLYSNAVKWITENHQDKRIPDLMYPHELVIELKIAS